MNNGASLEKVNTGYMVVFEDPTRFCLILKGRIVAIAPGHRQEMGPEG